MTETGPAESGSSAWARRLRRVARQVLPVVIGLGAIGGIIVILNPGQVGGALEHFRLWLLAPAMVLYLLCYLFQGVRWHFLLRDIGLDLSMSDAVLLNAAGQAITALVPLGDLTRAAFASEAGGKSFGTVAATVTVQEVTYTLTLVLLALPVLFLFHLGAGSIAAVAIGLAIIVVVLTVSPVFRLVHGLIARIPVLNRILPAVDDLRHETSDLLHRPDTLGWSVLDLARSASGVTALWLIVEGVAPGAIGWWDAAFVLALASIGGAVSVIPGGVGANEAGVVGLLIFFHVHGGDAGAAAIIQRVLITGIPLIVGFGAYAIARRRFNLGGIFQITARQREKTAA
ncbi:MAG TPA: lysylphosphatidylglycerol synthase transmembrane domain-containing protein [Candidatus Dormibacteraeota bacterium]|nr:lysylphosphatidylglycerol synthase transmembrane domain-containing protein [Candidatus Dormibacteraeota bacterium]